jgi:hypothetical protein
MSGGRSESLLAVNIHEVQNSIVSLLSFLRKKKGVPIRNESHNCWLFRCHFSQCPCFLKYFELTVSTGYYRLVRNIIVSAHAIRRVAITQASFLCLTAGSPAAMLAGVERLDLLEKWQVS